MPKFQSTPQFEHGLKESTGILVVNLGTPDAPTAKSVRRFLKQFLSDPRVVEYPRLIWWLALNLVILRIRPSRSAAAYKKIWTPEGSPLQIYSEAIASKMQSALDAGADDSTVRVELAMNYGTPSIADAIDKLLAIGARRLLVLPLYPQYSGTTTASVFDAVARKLGRLRWIPELRFVNDYCDDPRYIEALATSIRENWSQHGRGDRLLMSFHGVPASTLSNGDPYHCQCQKTGRLLAAALGLSDDEWLLSFQSRVGREQWLTPYTDSTVATLGEQGLARLDVVCPGFATDCLETLEEIEMQNAELFIKSGGTSLHYVPALNASDSHVDFLTALARQHLGAWDSDDNGALRDNARQRAMTMGAHS